MTQAPMLRCLASLAALLSSGSAYGWAVDASSDLVPWGVEMEEPPECE
eukprot:CAMPEP_0171247442 /NCGR_PEP_ID=MMETSP0790-20130122/48497_1 /TAXON_ID=2925 /ORGANISM="Alexandrium catenella, Strain OF101" /LENGTH=47 /DNA_ID= /DNA_START= /DNA_END= /DNA_ORIENTATION=